LPLPSTRGPLLLPITGKKQSFFRRMRGPWKKKLTGGSGTARGVAKSWRDSIALLGSGETEKKSFVGREPKKSHSRKKGITTGHGIFNCAGSYLRNSGGQASATTRVVSRCVIHQEGGRRDEKNVGRVR